MLHNEKELRTRIHDFMRRKETQYPGLIQASSREKLQREQFKPSAIHNVRFAFGRH
ncbi:MAG TPA: hypothetical protein VIR03_01610 [Candidatus Saccharimonadales bacterium]